MIKFYSHQSRNKYFNKIYDNILNFSCDESDTKENIQSINKVCLKVLRNVYNCERFASEVFAVNRTRNVYVCKCVLGLLLEQPRMENEFYLGCTKEKNILYHLIFVCVPQGGQWSLGITLLFVRRHQ